MTWIFSHFFLLLCSASSWEPNFWLKMYFFINTNLIYVDLLYKRLSYRVKIPVIWSFQTFSLFPYKMRKISWFLVAGSSVPFSKSSLHPNVEASTQNTQRFIGVENKTLLLFVNVKQTNYDSSSKQVKIIGFSVFNISCFP
jgi:hypothetical protein